jgi:hypothetical protein
MCEPLKAAVGIAGATRVPAPGNPVSIAAFAISTRRDVFDSVRDEPFTSRIRAGPQVWSGSACLMAGG